MNNDLISREALKEEVKTMFCPDGYKIMMLKEIDDAPTVEPCLSFNNVSDEDIEKFKLIWQRATSKGLRLINERPQGEWNEIQAGMFACPFCGARPHKDFKNFCAKCGADMRKGGAE